MGKYPIDITDEENAKLKYPFRPTEEYDWINHIPGGPTVTITGKVENIPKSCIAQMIQINKEIYLQRLLEEMDAEGTTGLEEDILADDKE